MTDEITDQELARLRVKWNIPDLPKAEAATLAQFQADPLPAKVLVRKERCWGDLGTYFRWFFIPLDASGNRGHPINTTNEKIAKETAQRYQKAGVPMEVLKEVEFE
ncbi:hypothetical protein [Rhizobium rhizogenes]|uniref:hypothetical protein n=1 Tax=Rhizobium rhizogenes TaxID=359 RepID=UPI0024BEAD7B|nr:hypothetical protein [Rhizobium rhizogenes]MDJ1632511.1 hypothetical protein [Rhizobium rhizogenes]